VIGSGRQDGQGDARVAPDWLSCPPGQGASVSWFACTAWNKVAKNASLRP
jgi:hypothetical protein